MEFGTEAEMMAYLATAGWTPAELDRLSDEVAARRQFSGHAVPWLDRIDITTPCLEGKPWRVVHGYVVADRAQMIHVTSR